MVRATQILGASSVQLRGTVYEVDFRRSRVHTHASMIAWSRYFSEMLSSQFMGDEVDGALNSFRESHGGTLSGMTRCDAFTNLCIPYFPVIQNRKFPYSGIFVYTKHQWKHERDGFLSTIDALQLS